MIFGHCDTGYRDRGLPEMKAERAYKAFGETGHVANF
jgi:hypothetical protein